MRCRAWVVEKPGRKLANGVRAVRVESVSDAYPRERTVVLYEDLHRPQTPTGIASKPERFVLQPTPPREDATLCGGEIEAEVNVRDEPYYGGTSAVLEISYKCTRCNHTYHGPDLPDTSEKLSQVLTDYIASLPEVTL